ncbi:MAG: HlyD family type I secretion periplasmic adaptor subunit [Hyphomicrobiaceae bacterium]
MLRFLAVPSFTPPGGDVVPSASLVLLAAEITLALLVLALVFQRLRKYREHSFVDEPEASLSSAGAASSMAMAVAKSATTAVAPSAPLLPGDLTRALDPTDREFLPAALELLETPPSPVRIAGIWLICSGVVVALAWSYFGKLDIHAVAQGRIQPSGRSKVIQPVEAGKVVAIFVENGSRVKAGDILLELDPTETGADRQSQTRELESARAEAARRRIAIKIARDTDRSLVPKPIAFDPTISDAVRSREELVLAGDLGQLKSSRANQVAQLAERMATRDKLTASIESRAKVIALAKERVDMRTQLNDTGSLSRALVIEVLSQYESHMTAQTSEKGQLVETEAAINTVASKIEELISQFVSDQSSKLAEAERKADRIAQDLVKATAKNERATLKSPITGTIQQLAVSTVGQVVSGAQSLMTIVPTDGPIEIEAMIQNLDIGFVNPGQDAIIKIEAFPFTRFGSISGKVARVSRDAVEERDAIAMADPMQAARPGGATSGAGAKGPNLVFPATVRLEKSTINVDGKEIALSPGMSVTVEILTGQRRAIDYVLAPLREVAANSGRER